jgi:hypothetical protein
VGCRGLIDRTWPFQLSQSSTETEPDLGQLLTHNPRHTFDAARDVLGIVSEETAFDAAEQARHVLPGRK